MHLTHLDFSLILASALCDNCDANPPTVQALADILRRFNPTGPGDLRIPPDTAYANVAAKLNVVENLGKPKGMNNKSTVVKPVSNGLSDAILINFPVKEASNAKGLPSTEQRKEKQVKFEIDNPLPIMESPSPTMPDTKTPCKHHTYHQRTHEPPERPP